MKEFNYKLLVSGAKKLGITLSKEQVQKFFLYSKILARESKRLGLSTVRVEDIVEDHFLDSLTIFQSKKIKAAAKVADVGSGAGFPGIPVKIVQPNLEVVLIESNKKKAAFLEDVVGALALTKILVLPIRAEEVGRDPLYRGYFDLVIARAVIELPVLLEYTLPLLRKGGWCLALKGPRVSKELRAASKAVEILGAVISEIIPTLSFTEPRKRVIVLVKKILETPERYPRRPGIPKKRPLPEERKKWLQQADPRR